MPEPTLPPGTRRSAALVALVLLVLAFPAVFFGGRTLRMGPGLPGVVPTGVWGDPNPTKDVALGTMDFVSAFIDEPLAELMAQQLRDGGLPLWNPWNGCGAPLFGNMQSAPLSPFRWPALLFPDTLWVYDAGLLLRLFIAGLFAFLYVTQRGLSRIAAAAAAGTFMLAGYFVLHATMHHLSVEVLLPALFFFVDRFALRPGARTSAFIGLLLTGWGTIVGGNPEATILVVLPAAAYVLAHLRAWGARTVLGIAGTLALSAGCGAPYLLAGAEYLANATHHHQGVASGLDHYQPWTLVSYLSPGAFGAAHPYAPPYLSLPAVALALLALRVRAARLPVWFFACMALMLWAKALGCPGVQLIGRLPVLDMLFFYKYGNPALAFAVAVLAAAGVQAILESELRWGMLWLPLTWIPLLAGAWAWAGAERRARGIENWQASLGDPELWVPASSALALTVVLVALLAARGAHRHGRFPAMSPPRRLAALLAAGVVMAQLLLSMPVRLHAPVRGQPLRPRLDAYRPAPYVELLRADPRPFRTFGVEDALPPNVNAALGIADVRSHDGLYASRFDRYIAEFLNPNNHSPQFDGRLLYPTPPEQLERHIAWSQFFLERRIEHVLRSHNGFTMDFTSDQKMKGYDLAGVRYVLFNPNLRAGPLAFVAARPDRWRLAYDEEMVVLENLQAFPRAFLARAARQVADAEAAVQALKAPDFPLDRTIALEADAANLPAVLPAGEADFRTTPGCTITEHTADAVWVRIDTPAHGFVVLTDTIFPGWTAEVDGQPAPIAAADLLFRAVRVTPEARVVTFRYQPQPVRIGGWIAAGSALLAAILAIFLRRSPAPA